EGLVDSADGVVDPVGERAAPASTVLAGGILAAVATADRAAVIGPVTAAVAARASVAAPGLSNWAAPLIHGRDWRGDRRRWLAGVGARAGRSCGAATIRPGSGRAV